ncbi:MAG: M20 metallopeptidase family protein [Sphingobacteriaceae bacterium]
MAINNTKDIIPVKTTSQSALGAWWYNMGRQKLSFPAMIGAIIAFSLLIPNLTVAQETNSEWERFIPADKIIEWRRHLHENPELSFEEYETSQYVEQVLQSFGNVEVVRPTETSVLGILKGNKPGKTVAFRADIDAIPVQEMDGLHDFTSKIEGISHTCGHDAHTAVLLGTVATLSKLQDEIAGTVYFIFQHAEEVPPGGAIDIVRSGKIDQVDAFFGMHIIPNFPAGHVGILPAIGSTTSDVFELTIFGKGTHGSMPHLGIDPIVIGAEIVTSIQSHLTRQTPPDETTVVSIGKFHSGEVANVIPDKAELAATIRTSSQATRERVEKSIRATIENTVKSYEATYELDYQKGYPAIENDEDLTTLVRESAISVLGEKNVFDAPALMASEDFANYKQIAPISYFILGIGDGPANHNPGFNPDESSFTNGVRVQVQTLLDYLNDSD